MEFGQFCCGELQNFANWPAEFGKIFRGELWTLLMISINLTKQLIQTCLSIKSESL